MFTFAAGVVIGAVAASVGLIAWASFDHLTSH